MNKHAWMGVAALLLAGPASSQDTPTGSVASAAVQTKTEESQLARLVAEKRDPQGRRCELRATATSGNLRYLACGEAGVWTVQVTPRRAEVIDQRTTPGIAGGFFLRDGTLWVETTSVSAERLAPVAAEATIQNNLLPSAEAIGGTAAPAQPAVPATPAAPEVTPTAPPPAAAPEPPPAAPVTPRTSKLASPEFAPVEARVVSLEPGIAIIDMGSEHGVASGDHVSFEQTTTERIGEEDTAVSTKRIAVGVATTIGVVRSKVQLGVDERVEVGAFARPTRDELTTSSFAPPRLGRVWHASFIARPFVVVDNFGVGGSVEGRVGYRFDAPFHLEALVLPLAIGTGREDPIGAAAAVVTASFDSKLFEVGLGVGGQTVNDPAFDLDAGSGTTLAQRLRVGSVDGGMIEVITYVVLFHSEFDFSQIFVHGQLPVGERSWLVANVAGGSLGMGMGDLGLRVLLNGNGDIGSFFLTATIGGIHLFRSTFCSSSQFNCSAVDYSGPLAGVGGEFRF